jgi:anti-sigma B factor antagonist
MGSFTVPAHRLPVAEIAVVGDFDVAAAPAVDAVLGAVAALHPAELVVDLSGCDFLDATGIGVLVRAHHRACAAGAALLLWAPQPQVRRTLRIVQVDRVLRILDPPVAGRPDLLAPPVPVSRPAGSALRRRRSARPCRSRPGIGGR